jgi:hypothetical protein
VDLATETKKQHKGGVMTFNVSTLSRSSKIKNFIASNVRQDIARGITAGALAVMMAAGAVMAVDANSLDSKLMQAEKQSMADHRIAKIKGMFGEENNVIVKPPVAVEHGDKKFVLAAREVLSDDAKNSPVIGGLAEEFEPPPTPRPGQ